ncbi:MAG: hypothetical protein K8R58_07360, partial [Bacteroidales bacterium]|nr:hypothetical protein [Bacteroidales bacterium]
MENNYSILVHKLDRFIRKYYKNQLIKGCIYSIATLLLFYIFTTLLEYFAHFRIIIRTIIFYSYLLINILILIKLIIIPLFKLIKIGKIITHKQAAEIIGKHFPDIKDKLTNTLQLLDISKTGKSNIELIKASIDQKILQLKPISFSTAIDLTKNKKYLKYAFPPILLLIIILFSAPSIITESTSRLIKHNEFFEKKFPFHITILNNKLEVIQHEDFKLEVKITGDEIPENIFLEYDNSKFKLLKESTILFYHNFNNLQKNIRFNILAEKFRSKDYEIKVLPKPIVLDFEIELNYPEYTKKINEELINTGDLIVPAGTKINWKFYTKHTSNVLMRFNNKVKKIEQKYSNTFTYSDSFYKNQLYSVSTLNEFLKNNDSLLYSINIIPDLYPGILLEQYHDSIYDKRLYFKGLIKDDYGFKLLTFNYKFLNDNAESSLKQHYVDTIRINKAINQQQFFHYFNLDDLAINPGDEIEYYFEVWDNDGINGSKSTSSQIMLFKAPTLKEIEEKTENSNKELKNEMEKTINDAKMLQKQIDELNKKLFDKKTLSWEDKKQIQDLLDKQKELQDKVETINQQNEEKSFDEQQYKQINEDIYNKQKQLEELFDKL